MGGRSITRSVHNTKAAFRAKKIYARSCFQLSYQEGVGSGNRTLLTGVVENWPDCLGTVINEYSYSMTALVLLALLTAVAMSRFTRWKSHRTWGGVKVKWSKWTLLPVYEMVFLIKFCCLLVLLFVQATFWSVIPPYDCGWGSLSKVAETMTGSAFFWAYSMAFSFLVAQSGGARTMRHSIMLSAVLVFIFTIITYGESLGALATYRKAQLATSQRVSQCQFLCCDFGMTWTSPTFLSDSWPKWIGGDYDAGDHEVWMALYAWMPPFCLLTWGLGAVLYLLGKIKIRQKILLSAALLLWAIDGLFITYSTATRLGSLIDTTPIMIGTLVTMPFIWYIFLLDSREWSSFSLEEDNRPESLDKIEANPLMLELATRRVAMEEAKRAPHIQFTDIRFKKKLAAGGTATVWKADVQSIHCKGKRAVKSIQCEELDRMTIEVICTEVEVSWLFGADCPYIVHCDGFTVEPPNLYIVMQLCDMGSLTEVLTGTISMVDRLKLAHETSVAVAHLHSLEFLHRDIKSFNVLCSSTPNEHGGEPLIVAHLSDFGETITTSAALCEAPSMVGTLPWMAPEIIDNWKAGKSVQKDGSYFAGNCYTKACDCFSLTVVLWECLTQRRPYANTEATFGFMLGDAIVGGRRPSSGYDDSFPGDLDNLIEQGWHEAAEKRPTAEELAAATRNEMSKEMARGLFSCQNDLLSTLASAAPASPCDNAVCREVLLL